MVVVIVGVLLLFLVQYFLVLRRDLRATVAGSQAVLVVSDASEEAEAAGLAPGQALLIQNAATLGRGAGNAVIIPDSLASLVHARLIYRGGAWWVEDLGSTNGTFVNRDAVREPVRLTAGDVLGCGPQVSFLFGET